MPNLRNNQSQNKGGVSNLSSSALFSLEGIVVVAASALLIGVPSLSPGIVSSHAYCKIMSQLVLPLPQPCWLVLPKIQPQESAPETTKALVHQPSRETLTLSTIQLRAGCHHNSTCEVSGSLDHLRHEGKHSLRLHYFANQIN